MNSAFAAWLPIRRGQTDRTHGEVIAVRTQVDRAALLPLPAAPFLVDDKYLRRVGKDCLVSFEASLYSVPARRVRAGQTVELRVLSDVVTIHALDGELLARHAAPAAAAAGSSTAHWDGLPDGHTRATVIELPHRDPTTASAVSVDAPLAGLLPHRRRADVAVATRPLADYAAAAEAVNRR